MLIVYAVYKKHIVVLLLCVSNLRGGGISQILFQKMKRRNFYVILFKIFLKKSGHIPIWKKHDDSIDNQHLLLIVIQQKKTIID